MDDQRTDRDGGGSVRLEVIQADPKERLPNLSDASIEGVANLMIGLPRYCCPHCGEYTAFEILSSTPSPLPDEVRAAFDRLTRQHSPAYYGYSDFLCRVCSRPVRVSYCIEEFRVGLNSYIADLVLETK